MNDSVRWGLIVAGAAVVACLGLRLLATGGHVLADTAQQVEKSVH